MKYDVKEIPPRQEIKKGGKGKGNKKGG